MALANRFEDLRAWQAARGLTIRVYALARGREFGRDFALSDQIRRASVSTMNNIAEGFDSASRADFTRFLRYASRSASEVQSCLHVARDQRYIDNAQFDAAYGEAALVRKLCGGLIRSLGGRWRSGSTEPQVNEPLPPPYGNHRPHRPPAVSLVVGRHPASPVTGHRSPVTPCMASE